MVRVGPRTIKFTLFVLISYLAGKNHKYGRIYIGVTMYKLKIFIDPLILERFQIVVNKSGTIPTNPIGNIGATVIFFPDKKLDLFSGGWCCVSCLMFCV